MSEPQHGGAIVADHLQDAGISHIFTLCGGHISPILVQSKQRGIGIVDVRSEASAVFAADAQARLTGRPGVAVVTAGPGVTNSITAVKNAQMAQSPVLVIGGATPTVLKNRGSLQDIDQISLMESLTKWQASVKTLAQLDDAMAHGLKVAASGVPGPVFIEAPIDILYPREMVHEMYADQAGIKHLKGPVGTAARTALDLYLKRQEYQPSLRLHPDAAALPRGLGEWRAGGQVRSVARKLAKAERPVLVLGSQVVVNRDLGRAAEVASAVARLGIPTWTGGMARGLLGAEHTQLFRHKRSNALAEADLVIIAGFPFDFRLKYGRGFARDAEIVSINLSRDDLYLNRKPDIPVLDHPGDFLEALAEQSGPEDWNDWFDTLSAREQEAMLGDNIGTYLRHTDYHQVAEGYGGKGLLVTQDEQIPEALQQARELAAQGTPVCINLMLASSDFRKGSISM